MLGGGERANGSRHGSLLRWDRNDRGGAIAFNFHDSALRAHDSFLMEITEAQLGWIMGCLLLFGLVIGWPSITTALALLREERVLGRLYWHLRTALDRLRQRG
jgi:hypothetical protein